MKNNTELAIVLLLLLLPGCISVGAQDRNDTLEVFPIHEARGADVTYDPETGRGVLYLLPPTSLVLLADRPERVVIPVNVSDVDELSDYIQVWEAGFSNATGGDPNAVLAGSTSDGTLYSLLVTLHPPSIFGFLSPLGYPEVTGRYLLSPEYPFDLIDIASSTSERGKFTGISMTSASLIVDPIENHASDF